MFAPQRHPKKSPCCHSTAVTVTCYTVGVHWVDFCPTNEPQTSHELKMSLELIAIHTVVGGKCFKLPF